MPTLLLAYKGNLEINSFYKPLRRSQYLEILHSDSAILFPSFQKTRNDIFFYRPPNEKGETGRFAFMVPVIAYKESND